MRDNSAPDSWRAATAQPSRRLCGPVIAAVGVHRRAPAGAPRSGADAGPADSSVCVRSAAYRKVRVANAITRSRMLWSKPGALFRRPAGDARKDIRRDGEDGVLCRRPTVEAEIRAGPGPNP